MKNSADQGGCYPPRRKAKVDNTLRDLQNSSYSFKIFPRFTILLFVFLLIKNKTSSSPGFLSQWLNNLSQAALLMSF